MPLERRRAILLIIAKRASIRATGFHDNEVTHGRRPVVKALVVKDFLDFDVALVEGEGRGDGGGGGVEHLADYLRKGARNKDLLKMFVSLSSVNSIFYVVSGGDFAKRDLKDMCDVANNS